MTTTQEDRRTAREGDRIALTLPLTGPESRQEIDSFLPGKA